MRAIAIILLLAALTSCTGKLDTQDMGVGGYTKWDDGPAVGVAVSGPKVELSLDPTPLAARLFGSPDAETVLPGETLEAAQARLSAAEARIAEMETAGNISPEQAADLRSQVDEAKTKVEADAETQDESPPFMESVGLFLAGNWWGLAVLWLGWVFRKFLGRAVVSLGSSVFITKIHEAILAYDKQPYENADGVTATEAEIVAAAKTKTPTP